MRNILFFCLLIAFCLTLCTGCSSKVVYDENIESFRYKPECEWDYFKQL